ncbi:MAG: class IIb bacteriocin, lactobin A/cerein 7B family [Pseudanabaena sp. SU_2_4]|nr:class IIb bacteriocin, lactobin A/cerein 7B family [Pseudanabaena sp. SU_2_4]
MDVLTESEIVSVNGGLSPIVIYTVAINSWWFVGASAAGLSIGYTVNRK